jgi:hypothetical protein
MNRLLLALAIAPALSCADFVNEPDPAFGLPDTVVANPSLSRDVQPILTRRCSIGGCHSLATQQGGLALSEGASHAALVSKPSRLRPGTFLVVPHDASASWLMTVLQGSDAERAGVSRMPLASSPLTPNQLQTIANWINRGAPND